MLIVAVILLSGFAFLPFLVFAQEVKYAWQNYMVAYIVPLSIYLPLIIR
jgi:hypothetical protein